jgi:hypothetical protein
VVFVVQHKDLAGGRVVGRHRGHGHDLRTQGPGHGLAHVDALATTGRDHHAGLRRAELVREALHLGGRDVAGELAGAQRHPRGLARSRHASAHQVEHEAVGNQHGRRREQGGLRAQLIEGARALQVAQRAAKNAQQGRGGGGSGHLVSWVEKGS